MQEGDGLRSIAQRIAGGTYADEHLLESGDAVYVKDRRGRYLMANPAAAALLGADASELIGRTEAALRGGGGEGSERADLELMEDGAEGTVAAEEPGVVDGSARTFLRSRTLLRDAEGEVVGLVGVISDITDDDELSQRLGEREAQLAEAEAIAQVGTWEWDIHADTVTWSPQFYDMLAMDPSEVEPTQAGFLDLIHPNDRLAAKGALERALAGGDTYSMAHRLVRPDGEERMMLCRDRIYRDLDGSPLRMVGASIDLSDYMDVGEALKHRHDQLVAAEELAGSGSFEYDVASDRVRWSDGMYRLFRLRRDEFDGTFEAYVRRVHPDERAERRSEFERLMSEGGVLESTQRIRRGDGSFTRIQSRVEVEQGPQGPRRLLGVCWAIGDA